MQLLNPEDGVLDYAESMFHKPPVDLRYKRITFQRFDCMNSIKNAKNFSFYLPPWKSRTYYQLHKTIVVLKLALVTDEGNAIKKNQRVAFCNNILDSIMSSVKIWLNDKAIVNNADDYNYKRYFEIMLTDDWSRKHSILQSQGYFPDTAPYFESDVDSNSGFVKRMDQHSTITGADRVYSADPVTYVGLLGCDLRDDILNGVSVKINFKFTNSEFTIFTPDDAIEKPKYVVDSFYLLVPCCEMEDSTSMAIERSLEKKPYTMFFNRGEALINSIPMGAQMFFSDTLFNNSSQLPSKITVGFVPTNAFQGAYSLNPYFFRQEFKSGIKITSQELFVNGSSIDGITDHDFKLDFYKNYLYGNYLDTGSTCSINLTEFLNGVYLVTYDLSTSAGSSPSGHIAPGIRVGNCRYVDLFLCINNLLI